MASFGEGEGEEGEEEGKKVDSSGETEKRDFRGINLFLCHYLQATIGCISLGCLLLSVVGMKGFLFVHLETHFLYKCV